MTPLDVGDHALVRGPVPLSVRTGSCTARGSARRRRAARRAASSRAGGTVCRGRCRGLRRQTRAPRFQYRALRSPKARARRRARRDRYRARRARGRPEPRAEAVAGRTRAVRGVEREAFGPSRRTRVRSACTPTIGRSSAAPLLVVLGPRSSVMPSASSSAVSMESATRRRMSGLATSRSTTTSIVLVRLASRIGSPSSRTSPSMRARGQFLRASSSSSRLRTRPCVRERRGRGPGTGCLRAAPSPGRRSGRGLRPIGRPQ